METDPELVQRGRDGDERAFQELVERYQHQVYALMHRAVTDRSRVEDLAQEVFLRVYGGLPYFRGEARVSTWIYRIVADTCTREAAREPLPLDGADETDDAERVRTPLQTGARRASHEEWRGRLDQAIARLPVSYRLLIAAHGQNGIRYEDLAEALELPAGSVLTHLHRARRQLRRLLDGEP